MEDDFGRRAGELWLRNKLAEADMEGETKWAKRGLDIRDSKGVFCSGRKLKRRRESNKH